MGSTAAATSSILFSVEAARTGVARLARACFLPFHAVGAGARS